MSEVVIDGDASVVFWSPNGTSSSTLPVPLPTPPAGADQYVVTLLDTLDYHSAFSLASGTQVLVNGHLFSATGNNNAHQIYVDGTLAAQTPTHISGSGFDTLWPISVSRPNFWEMCR